MDIYGYIPGMCFLCAVVFEFSKGLYIWRLLWVNSEEPQHFTPLSVVFCDISCLLSPNFFVFAIWRGFAIVMCQVGAGSCLT